MQQAGVLSFWQAAVLLHCTRASCNTSCAVSKCDCRDAEDLDEMNIEIMRNTLYKAYLDDFAAFCRRLGGATAEVMGGLLSFEVRYMLSQ